MNRNMKFNDRRSWDCYDSSPDYDRPPKRSIYDDKVRNDGFVAKEPFSSLRLSDFNPRVPDKEVRDAIFEEMKRFGDFNIKFAHTVDRRLVYVNFNYPEDAAVAKQALFNKLFLFDRSICIEPVFHNKPLFHRQNNGTVYRGGESPHSAGPRSSYRDVRDPYVSGDDHYFNSMRKEPKFSYHLNDVPPEEDEKATRTLFVGNIDEDMTPQQLSKYFEPFGIIEDVNVKHPASGSGNPYAFVRFYNLDMAHIAKVKLCGEFLGRNQCKIGYGKPFATSCVWIGGLGPWISKSELTKEFNRFGSIVRMEWPHRCNYAYVLYDNTEAAKTAMHVMRGYVFRGSKRGIRVDFVEERQMDGPQPQLRRLLKRMTDDRDVERSSQRRRSGNKSSDGESDSYGRKRRRIGSSEKRRTKEKKHRGGRKTRCHGDGDNNDSDGDLFRIRTSRRRKKHGASFSDSDSISSSSSSSLSSENDSRLRKEKVFQIGNIEAAETVLDLARCLPIVWSGSLVLKNSMFSTRMHLIYGDVQHVDTLMRDPTSTERPSLKITQRLRMDPLKLEEVERRISLSGPDGWCILLVMPGSNERDDGNEDDAMQQRPLKNLVSYLRQKDAAGVLSLPTSSKHGHEIGLLHTFPPCHFAYQYLLKHVPHLQVDYNSEDHIIVFLVRINV